jgi:hypothetical protein
VTAALSGSGLDPDGQKLLYHVDVCLRMARETDRPEAAAAGECEG